MSYKHFESLTEVLAFVKKNPSGNPYTTTHGLDSHWGGDGFDTLARKDAMGGEDTHVARAQAIMDRLESVFNLPKADYLPSVSGAYPCVPEYLAGYPEPMRRKILNLSESTPIKIWITTTSSSGCSEKCLIERGVALLGFAMALIAAGRPVELSVVSFLDGSTDGESVVTVAIPTSPLSLSHACFALCNQGYTRNALYNASHALDRASSGAWPMGFSYENPEPYCAQLATRMGVDFVAPPARTTDEQEIRKDPVAWLNSRMGKIKTLLGEAE